MKSFRLRALSCIVSLVMLIACVPSFALAEGSKQIDQEKVAFRVNSDTIVEIDKTKKLTSVKVYINGRLEQEATGDSNVINLVLYDGKTNEAPKLAPNSPNMKQGPLIRTVHAARSTDTFTGILTANITAKAGNVDSEPWFDNSGLSSVGSGWYRLGTVDGGRFAPAITAEVQRNMTKTKVGASNSWTWGPGTTVAAISAVLSVALSPTIVSWILGFASVTGGVLDYAFSPVLDEYEFDYRYRVLILGASWRTYRRNTSYWLLNTSTSHNNWKLKSYNMTAVSNYQQAQFAISDWIDAHTHDSCNETCSVCGLETGYTHNWGSWTTTKSATCTASGTQQRVCSKNSAHVETKTIAALGHSWNAWTTTKAATCTTAGSKKRTCKRNSSHTQTQSIAALGHSYPTNWTNSSTLYHTKKCSRCGNTISEAHEPQRGSRFCKCGRSMGYNAPLRPEN